MRISMTQWYLLLTTVIATSVAWPVSNRTACFKYIDCLEQSQSSFKKCSKGTVVALALETKDKLFRETASTQWPVVKSCQQRLELEGLDFDSLQALVNEDSRECFRRMQKRRVPLETVCEVDSSVPVAETSDPLPPRQCVSDFKNERKRCEKLLACCPEHVKCAERLNTLSIAYQEARRRSVDIAEKMLACVYETLGLPAPFAKKEESSSDILRRHRAVPTASTDRPTAKKATQHPTLKPLPVAIEEATTMASTNNYGKMGSTKDYKYLTTSGEYSFGPRTSQIPSEHVVREASTKKVVLNAWAKLSAQSSSKKALDIVEPSMDEKQVASTLETIATVGPKVIATTEPLVSIQTEAHLIKTSVVSISSEESHKDVKKETSDSMSDELYDDGTTLEHDVKELATTEANVESEANEEMETTTMGSSEESSEKEQTEETTGAPKVHFEIVEESAEQQPIVGVKATIETIEQSESTSPVNIGAPAKHSDDEKQKELGNSAMKKPLKTTDNNSTQIEDSEEAVETAKMSSETVGSKRPVDEKAQHRVEIVKFLLQSADDFESQIYLQLVADNNYDELERIAAEKKNREVVNSSE